MNLLGSLAISRSGLQLQALRQEVSANNVANLPSEAFVASAVQALEIQDGGVRGVVYEPAGVEPPMIYTPEGYRPGSTTDLVAETVGQIGTVHAFRANLAMIRSTDEMVGSLLDTVA